MHSSGKSKGWSGELGCKTCRESVVDSRTLDPSHTNPIFSPDRLACFNVYYILKKGGPLGSWLNHFFICPFPIVEREAPETDWLNAFTARIKDFPMHTYSFYSKATAECLSLESRFQALVELIINRTCATN